ncbi:unnamed protein product [Effrenium voratum]|nr:unnamed protein product [Effrenium voratum]
MEGTERWAWAAGPEEPEEPAGIEEYHLSDGETPKPREPWSPGLSTMFDNDLINNCVQDAKKAQVADAATQTEPEGASAEAALRRLRRQLLEERQRRRSAEQELEECQDLIDRLAEDRSTSGPSFWSRNSCTSRGIGL